MATPTTINIDDKLAQFDATWTPHIIAELNGQQVKLAKLEGEFTWHDHAGQTEASFKSKLEPQQNVFSPSPLTKYESS